MDTDKSKQAEQQVEEHIDEELGEEPYEEPDEQVEDGRQSPAFAIVDPDDPHGGRPRVIITQKPKYSVGRSVYVRVSGSAELQGPFLVATVTVSTAKYTLSYSSGIAAMSGSEIHEDDLVPG